MNHALSMSNIKSAGNLTDDVDRAIEHHRTLTFNDVLQRPAIQIFHHQEDDAVFIFAKIRNNDRVGMRNSGSSLRLAREASHNRVIKCERRTQDLDCDSL